MRAMAVKHHHEGNVLPFRGRGVRAQLREAMEGRVPVQIARERVASGWLHGYVIALGLWSPHINGLSVPVWSPQYQTYVVVTIGLLSAMFDEARLHREVAPRMLELSIAIGSLLDGTEADIFNRIESKPLPVSTQNNKIVKAEDKNELEAGARRSRAAGSLRARDGRR